MTYKIGVDGGGTKTECILIDEAGTVLARHLAPGCNPSVVGPDQARLIVTDALCGLVDAAFGVASAEHPAAALPRVAATQLYMAGSPPFWREFGASLSEFGHVTNGPDSLPVLELATHGKPGLVIHAGTGSFVAARAPDGTVHYAGGLGWRFGDPGSGFDLGRRAVSRALLELQGWAPSSRLAATVRDHAQLPAGVEARAVTGYFYQHPDPNRVIAALAPALLRLAAEGDHTSNQLVVESVSELLALGTRVATKLFPDTALDALPAGLSGPILNHPVVLQALASRSPLSLAPVEGAPIDGVRRLLLRG